MSSLYCVTDILLIFYLNLSSLHFFFSVRFFSASHFSRELGITFTEVYVLFYQNVLLLGSSRSQLACYAHT